MIIGGPLSLLPVIVAIVLALWTREVILSLLLGVLSAALLLHGGDPQAALVHTVDPLLLDAVADRDHVKVTLFSLFIAATIEVLTRSGATRALVDLVTRRARTRRSGMVATWFAGMVVFFDDYANCLVVGSAMRPVSDRLRISREKLAFLVDTTAAPMATLALVSTWVGYEVSLMGDALAAAGQDIDAYAFWIQGIPYRAYPILALFFAGMVAVSGRDFGPMLAAEARAQARNPEAETDPGPTAWPLVCLAVLAIGLLVGVTLVSLWQQGAAGGTDRPLFEIIGDADGYDAMLHGSIAGLTAALLGGGVVRALNPKTAMSALVDGMGKLFPALVVLYLAWALSSAIGELKAADYLVALLGDTMPAWSLPTVVFLLSAAVAFATGTSFGTMGVLIPLVIPLSVAASTDPSIALAASAAVLSGATWGDHCSPISDTTVLSSTGSGCDHSAHVATQLPYALVTGGISVVACTLPVGLGLNPWLSLVVGLVACAGALWLLGKPVARPASAT